MFKLVAGDYYHVPAAQVQQICPELQTTVDQAIQNGTVSMTQICLRRPQEHIADHWNKGNDELFLCAPFPGAAVEGLVDSQRLHRTRQVFRLEGEAGKEKADSRQSNTPEICSLTRHTFPTTGCELTTYEPISSFLTDACVYILATNHNLHTGAEAAVAATQDRAAEILDCLADTESTFDPRAAVFHLESLLAAARLACGQSVQQQPQKQQFLTTTEGSGEGVCVGGDSGTDSRGLRAMVVATCATLRPLLAELPALQVAVAEDAEFAAMWERVNRGGFGSTRFTPVVRERMQWAIESCGS